MCGTDSASPPTRSCRSPRSAAGCSSIIRLNRLAVSHSVLTPCAAMQRPSASRLVCPGGINTSRAPFSSAPQISNVAASNETGAFCRNTSAAENRA